MWWHPLFTFCLFDRKTDLSGCEVLSYSCDVTISGQPQEGRTPTRIDALCNDFVESMSKLDPMFATHLGIRESFDLAPDFSPAMVQEQHRLGNELAAAVAAEQPVDDIDRVTQAAVAERQATYRAVFDANLNYGEVNVISCPVQQMRDVFDIMPSSTTSDWEAIAGRLGKYDQAVDSYVLSLEKALSVGNLPALRQVEAVIDQIDKIVDPNDGQFKQLVQRARPDGLAPTAALATQLDDAANVAAQAFARLRGVLADKVAPVAVATDSCGKENYALFSRVFLGATIDLEETYEWGVQELAGIEAEMSELAREIAGTDSITEAIAALDEDSSRNISDPEAFRDWMQAVADEAITSLDNVHFEIPDQIRQIDCKLAPSASGCIYYSPPSEDFSRPGAMWWSVPPGQESFATWSERTTVYHEGVPGHHLQIGQAMVSADSLNRWRRLMCWVSGHGEGWALYAERLMADLGFLEDPADRLGMLAAAAMRAMRVVIDVGLHCGFEAPAEVGGGVWTGDQVREYQRLHARIPDAVADFEHLRYLGWPGQAASYKIGERLWLQVRDDVRQAAGDSFDVKKFHHDALLLGSLGLDTMSDVLRGK